MAWPTVVSEVKEVWQVSQLASSMAGIGQLSVGIPELVEEGVHHGVNGSLTFGWCVLQQSGDEVDSISVGLSEDLVEGVRLDLRELVLHVVGVHGANLLPSRRAENFDDLNQLVNTRFTREQRLAKHQFSHNTSSGPNICRLMKLANIYRS
jgi:hypothetical protein